MDKIPTPSVNDSKIWDIWMSQHYLRTVTVSMKIGLFSFLVNNPSSDEQVVAGLHIGPRSCKALLGVLAGLGLLEQHKGKYYLTEHSKIYLVKESPFYWGPMLLSDSMPEHHNKLLEALENDKPTTGKVVFDWEAGQLSDETAKAQTESMHAHSFPAAIGVAQNFDWSQHHKILDIAGGSGCFSIKIAQNYPKIHCTVLELPAVCKLVQEYAKQFGVSKQVDTISLNMFKEDWPFGYDVHFFSNIFHDWSLETNHQLANSSFKALPSGGKIFLHEMILDDGNDGPVTTACFSMHMLLYTRGNQFTFVELETLLKESGFKDIQITKTYGYYSLVSGTKP